MNLQKKEDTAAVAMRDAFYNDFKTKMEAEAVRLRMRNADVDVRRKKQEQDDIAKEEQRRNKEQEKQKKEEQDGKNFGRNSRSRSSTCKQNLWGVLLLLNAYE